MAFRRHRSRLAVLITCIVGPNLLGPATASRAQSSSAGPMAVPGDMPADYSRISAVPRAALDGWLKRRMRASGADPSSGRYRFILGFSTGHYATDPVQALATRRAAFGLLNNTFAAGDHVLPVAWEMTLWNVGPDIALTPDPATREQVVNALPYTPAQNTIGGHDTERALYDVLTKVVPAAEAPFTVVLLFTNSGQSQVGDSSHVLLFGQTNPELAQALAARDYRDPERTSFMAHGASGSRIVDVPVYVVALFPRHLVSLPGAGAGLPRYPTFSLDSWRPDADRPASASELPNPASSDIPRSAQARVPLAAPTIPLGARPQPTIPFSLLWPLVIAIAAGCALWLVQRYRSTNGTARKRKMTSQSKGRPIPGRLTVTFGIGNGAQETILSPLRDTQIWGVEPTELVPTSVGSSGPTASGKSGPLAELREVKSIDRSEGKSAAPAVTPLATIGFESTSERNSWRVVCSAARDYQFRGVVAKGVDQSDPRRLRIDHAGGDFKAELVHISEPRVPGLTIKIRYDKR